MGEQRHGEGVYQMLWDCRFCGTQKLLGVTHRHCPNCGAAQDPAWRYFPAEEDMVALENHQYVGADKICPACGQPNSAASSYCSECGADLATGKQVETQGERAIGTGIAESDTRRDVVKDQFDAEMARVKGLETAKPIFLGLRKKEWIIIGAVAAAALCIVAAVFAITYRKDVSGKVEALTWERTIDIENFQPRTDSSWDESVPGDAYSVSCSTRQRGTRRVETGSHQECKDVDQGDGSFRRECKTVTDYRDEPVYDQWCAYTVDRWGKNREVKAKGDVTQDPYWPQYSLASGSGSKRYGQERTGDTHEKYTVVIRDSGGKEKYTCDYGDQNTWARYSVEMDVALKVNITGGPDCDTVKPK
jgi:predicted nucleic acid-binding Zn ribbon protein